MKHKFPKAVNVLGYHYKIIFVDGVDTGGDEMGNCDSMRQEIHINQRLCEQQQRSTLLHEVMEAINYHLELGLEHTTIMGLESGLYQALTKNNILGVQYV